VENKNVKGGIEMKLCGFADLISYRREDLIKMDKNALIEILLWLKDDRKDARRNDMKPANAVSYKSLFKDKWPIKCPECGSNLKIKYNKKSEFLFLGCPRFRSSGCKGSVELLEYVEEELYARSKVQNAYEIL